VHLKTKKENSENKWKEESQLNKLWCIARHEKQKLVFEYEKLRINSIIETVARELTEQQNEVINGAM
jgi:hypothetical protein